MLPELLGIEADVAPDRSNVTLRVNGSTLADDATVECQNIVDAVTGQIQIMFQLTLLFEGNTFLITATMLEIFSSIKVNNNLLYLI